MNKLRTKCFGEFSCQARMLHFYRDKNAKASTFKLILDYCMDIVLRSA